MNLYLINSIAMKFLVRSDKWPLLINSVGYNLRGVIVGGTESIIFRAFENILEKLSSRSYSDLRNQSQLLFSSGLFILFLGDL